MNDPVFLDSAAFLRVWQRVTGEAGITAAPVQPEPDAITAKLRGCICAKAAGAAFYAALAQRVCAIRQPLGQIAAQERAQLRALQTEYFLRTGTLCVPPARGRARRRQICAASIGRSLRSARSWTRQPMLRRCRSGKRCAPWRSRMRATRSACARCSPG